MEQATASRIYTDQLKAHFIFISASFPRADRGADYFWTARPSEITDATLAAARAIFGARGKVVFGGHPTISPLILSVGRDFLLGFPEEDKPFVHIYQSQHFENRVPAETLQLAEEGIAQIHWVPGAGKETEKNLLKMRIEMLTRTRPIAGIFIGGMEGVYREAARESEFSLFKEIRRGHPIYPIGATGGGSQILLNRILTNQEPMVWHFTTLTLKELSQPSADGVLMKKIVSDIIEHLESQA